MGTIVGSSEPIAMQLRSLARRTLDSAQGQFASLRASVTLNEVSGAFGDIGTFLPLLVSKPSHTNLKEPSGVPALAEQHQIRVKTLLWMSACQELSSLARPYRDWAAKR